MKTVSSLLGSVGDKAGTLVENKLNQTLKANHTISNVLGSKANNAYFGLSAMDAKAHYKKLYSLGTIMQCNYAVYLNDIFNIGKGKIPWFHTDFPLSWLATDAEMSLGGVEAENFYAGSYQCNFITQQNSDTVEVTFIETRAMDISRSYDLCNDLIVPSDGSVREPKKYTFELVMAMLGNHRNYGKPVYEQRYLVAVKEGSFTLSSAGRSEIVKVQVTFQKIRPHGLFKNSVKW